MICENFPVTDFRFLNFYELYPFILQLSNSSNTYLFQFQRQL
jgi:hypothetical protein